MANHVLVASAREMTSARAVGGAAPGLLLEEFGRIDRLTNMGGLQPTSIPGDVL
jgi:hypothetical protein